ncbi:MAG: PHP domain-containing protein [Clostridiales bacterium]|nr:PHP domain-containing protein [Clostridiales bacterium]
MEYFYDFHIHSCLSACADDDMTPYNLVNMAKLAGLDIIALTDHNSCLNCPAAIRAGDLAGICVVPGMELCTQEEVHLICLFPHVEKALSFSQFVSRRLPQIENDPAIFGQQWVFDHSDRLIENSKLFLSGASSIGLHEAVGHVEALGGVCYPAHINRPSYSLLSNLGGLDESMRFKAFEACPRTDLNELYRAHPYLKKLHLLRGSDAHRLQDIADAANKINLQTCSPAGLIDFFNKIVL